MANPKLSIIIVNYRSSDVLRGCLQSLRVATDQSFEIILVDNSLQDGAKRELENSGLKGHYFAMPENLGYTRAANFGAEHAVGEYICFLNPDTLLEGHSIDRLLEWAEQHPRTVVGPRERNGDGQIVTTVFPQMTRRYILGANMLYKFPWPKSWHSSVSWLVPSFQYVRHCRNASEPFRAPVLSGFCFIVSRSVWQDVGPFEASLTYFGLEAEWFSRAAELGIVGWYIPHAEVFHEHATSIRRGDGFTVHELADENRRWHAKRIGLVTLGVLVVVLSIERFIRRRS